VAIWVWVDSTYVVCGCTGVGANQCQCAGRQEESSGMPLNGCCYLCRGSVVSAGNQNLQSLISRPRFATPLLSP
jgi:hypothetical protein